MTCDEIRQRITTDGVDTVIVCIPDMQGRLVGKRETAEFFLSALESGTHVCDYLFTVDVDGTPIPGFASASWEKGYGDYTVTPDFLTWKKVPWLPTSSIVIGDCFDHEGRLVSIAPRAVLRAQVEAARKRGYSFNFASELEFYLYQDSFDECLGKDFRDLRPSSSYSQDYNLLKTTGAEPLLYEVRKALAAMGIQVESTKGEWGPGQHEINLRYCDPLANADQHVIFKHALKEIAAQHGRSVTFMAKPYAELAGSSCHIHTSLWSADGRTCRSADHESADGLSAEFAHFIAGVLKYVRESILFFAPTVNSYKRFQTGSFAPTRVCWGRDNRTGDSVWSAKGQARASKRACPARMPILTSHTRRSSRQVSKALSRRCRYRKRVGAMPMRIRRSKRCRKLWRTRRFCSINRRCSGKRWVTESWITTCTRQGGKYRSTRRK